jgi:hypothetical protein
MNDVGYINIHGKIADNWRVKVTLSGENLVFQRGISDSNWIQPYSGKSQLRDALFNNGLMIESVNIYNSEKSLSFTFGGFNPVLVDGSVFTGPESPFLWNSKNYFAVDGFHVYHKPVKTIFGTEMEYEVYGGTTSFYNAQIVGPGVNIQPDQRTFGVTFKFNFQKGYFRISYNNIEDSREEFNPTGGTNIFVGPFVISLGGTEYWEWLQPDAPTLANFGGIYGGVTDDVQIGPQYQSTVGADFRYNISDRFSFEGRYATSRYLPVKELGLSTSGSMFDAKLHGTWGNTTEEEYEKEGLKAKSGHFTIEYLSVDPDFSPFIGLNDKYTILQPRLFFFTAGFYDTLFWGQLPYPVYIENSQNYYTYTSHNAKLYPNNREGLRLNVQYKFSDAFLGFASYEALTQKEAARDMDGVGGGTIKWGWYEPIFGTVEYDLGLFAGDVVKKGTINTFNIGFNYKFQGGRFDFTGQYYNTQVKRDIPATADNRSDNIDYKIRAFDVLFRYMPNEKWTWHIAYNSTQSDGKYFVAQNANAKNMSWETQAIRVGADWKVSEDFNFFANLKFLNYDSKNFNIDYPLLPLNVVDNVDWKGTQFWMGARVKFGQK